MTLTKLDLIVIAVPLLIVLGVSVVMRKYLRSVADFLAASRCAGRYMISTSASEIYATVVLMMTSMEMFSRAGCSLNFWNAFPGLLFFIFGLLGLVTYRFRETRVLTFHQLFEVRYSKNVRVLASFLNVFSGVFNFGVLPALAARFFVYFCGFPAHLTLLGATVPTFAVIMTGLMLLSLYMALSGGQVSIMVTDALEGMISSFFYLIVAGFIVFTVSFSQMRTALMSGTPGQSFIDPFDIGGRNDFNGWFVVLGLFLSICYYRGGAWQAGFIAAAKSAHESRMAQILGSWRGASYGAMATLATLGAFTLLHHPDFGAQRLAVEQGIQSVGSTQLQTQMRMPMALGVLLASGVKGAFCAVAVFGILASQGEQLHRYGTTFLQDVVLPFRKKPFEAKQHVWWLKFCSVAVAVFVCVFSYLYKPVDYLIMLTQLIGVIYLGGVGVATWGALYWKRGTTQGALVSLSLAGFFGIGLNVLQPLWPNVAPTLARWCGDGSVGGYIAAHADKFPLNGLQLSVIVTAFAAASYFIVSWLTCRQPFDLDAMLHRGQHGTAAANLAAANRPWYERLFDVDDNFTRGDKRLLYGTLVWNVFWQIVAVSILLWTIFRGRLSANWWFNYSIVVNVCIAIVLAVVTTIWFAFGVTRDLRRLFVSLGEVHRNDADDGTVRNHHNLGEDPAATAPPEKRV